MQRFFNTAGPVEPADHYCLAPLERVDVVPLKGLIDAKRYFILHAPRQTGKTTALRTLAAQLRREGRYRVLYTNVEVGQSARDNVAAGMRAMAAQFAREASFQDEPLIDQIFDKCWTRGEAHGIFIELLSTWAKADPARPAVLFVDEVDSLVGDTLISLLRQLRAGYPNRPSAFPQAVVLCGVRDVRDYRITTSKGEIITGGSAFNIKDESLRLGDFSRSEMEALLAQHTAATGQLFPPETLELFWQQTRGQPWLVNALAKQCCFKPTGEMDRTRPITPAVVLTAREELIRSRATHLDALTDKLHEERVRRVILPMLVGRDIDDDVPMDDQEYCLDLGLVRRNERKHLDIANPIYREIIPRDLTVITLTNLATRFQQEWCRISDGSLDADKLIGAFQAFWRKESDHGWVQRDYKEAECQLTLQTYLHRVVNGGGRIEREYALGRGRTDLAVIWPLPATPDRPQGGEQRIVIEVKVVYPKDSPQTRLAEGLDQTVDYGDCWPGADLHLVIFDQRPGIPWAERCRDDVVEHRGRRIRVWGM